MVASRKVLKSLVIILTLTLKYAQSKTVETTTNANDLKNNKNYTDETNTANGNSDKQMEVVNVTCRGAPEYCNMSKEDYIRMLDDYIFPSAHEWGLIATHLVVFVIGLVGNALVCVAVYRNSSMRKSVTYCCLVNLAVADFFVILLCLPPTVAWDVTETWFLGDVMCKTLIYFQSVSVTVSVLTLTYIALDRYKAIVSPFSFHAQDHPIIHVKKAISIIWLISLLFNMPDLIYLETGQQALRFDVPHLVQCQPTLSEQANLIWHIVKFVFVYTIPLLLIGGAYFLIILKLWKPQIIPGQADCQNLTNEVQQRSRRNVAKMLLTVVIMFAICYLPVHVLALLRYTGVLEQLNNNDVMSAVALVTHVLCYVNSAINPVIYNFMSEKFRREFRRAFCCYTEPVHENSTTMTLPSKSKRSFEMQSLTQRPASDVKNGYT